ncbi:hypothetical protein FHU12_5325 [Serratia marcescens]|uniref:Uncharacterized protein n=1 Tax=Serratia marcescens TaxID=615 RepID=A0AA46KAB5_SERMA|nr:hypothetical protein [Serratia marcescens]MBH3044778.1 hypothetical protein [Serratia marcescens]MBN5205195.1 hypothetical protein [Serratia marcescens]TQI87621.1 hypothetical protein FHU12_5325 [Serratia marcescens]
MKNLPNDYFLDADDELVDFLEAQGEACIKDIYQSNAVNKENGYKLLSILIVGIGSSFLLLTQRPNIDFLSAGLAVFILYWSLCAIYLVTQVLTVHMRGLVYASPEQLYTEKYKAINQQHFDYFKSNGFSGECNRLSVMRRYRLHALCLTANELASDNKKIRERLTWARMATIITPACALFISALTYLFS